MKARLTALVLSFVFFSSVVFAADQPQLSAKAAVLIDAFTGRILFDKNAAERHYPASITKIMTLIIAMEHGNINDIITISDDVPKTEGSSIYLEAGQIISLKDLLYGMMLQSGNDATMAVANHLSGNMTNFVQLMNQKAIFLGCNNTHFVNPNGLPDEQHYSTAIDMARITAYGYRFQLFEKIVSTEKYVIFNTIRNEYQALFNENKMLWRYDGCNGVKTGYTDVAGHTLTVGAKRNGIQLIAVVMDADEKWDDTAKMLDYGFGLLESKLLFAAGTEFGRVRIKNGENIAVSAILQDAVVLPTLKTGSRSGEITYKVDLPIFKTAPVKTGQQLGNLMLFFDGKQITSVPLVAAQDIEKKSIFWSLIKWLKNLIK
ncbi:MAG: D-alanyl-D-alanine carboxypeptidase family protein [Negativicutes bacterium]|jgi:D-alanyl-D-alanine carboxypeptidase (penicillin-binding protein 5/6)